MILASEVRLMQPVCRDVLDPRFDELNAAAGYDPAYNYVGSDWIQQHWHIELERHFLGADINRAAWLHDRAYEAGRTVADWDRANDEFRDNVIKLIGAAGQSRWRVLRWARIGAAHTIGWLHWLGVESAPALVDYWLCKRGGRGGCGV